MGKLILHPLKPVEKAIAQGFADLERKAEQLGADALIGVRNDATNSTADFNLLMGTTVRYR